MLRHVLCVLALALCCCTSVCVAVSDVPRPTVVLGVSNDDAEISLTETVDASSCTEALNSASGEPRTVTISTAPTLTKRSGSGTFPRQTESERVITVPDGYKLTLKSSLVLECTRKGEAASAATDKTCTFSESATGADYIKYDVTVETTATADKIKNTIGKEERKVSVPATYNVKAVGTVVVTCIPPTPARPSLSPAKSPAPRGELEVLTTNRDHEKVSSSRGSQLDGNTNNGANGNTATQGAGSSEKPEATADVFAPTSSEKDDKETDNSVTVGDADHATPQSETTTEGATNTDAGTSISAEEDMKLPDHNTDASSSTAWVRAPLLLLLACVAVW
ncbi:hypothetical protein DQ04_22171000 [Trypanosoma grayi]|uniref:hypothetical protein n=1 Tax=Trypanosoma grayi TaxID=71804 RepID=UPI0004F47569|nr:hypothetical protein DQ04_22171000 [Trypanosoma grayi]KEG05421.1 hypothetical protein DQ04_22171000 [Trypanosoma grayi]